MEIRFNDVRHAVAAALSDAFPDTPVFGDAPDPLPASPCLIVQLLEPTQTQELGRRYRRSHPFAIRYWHPAATDDDRFAMAEQLTEVLQKIPVGGRELTGQTMSFQVVEGELVVQVGYTLLVWQEAPVGPKMRTLEQEELVHD